MKLQSLSYHPWLSEINAPAGYKEVTDMPINHHCWLVDIRLSSGWVIRSVQVASPPTITNGVNQSAATIHRRAQVPNGFVNFWKPGVLQHELYELWSIVKTIKKSPYLVTNITRNTCILYVFVYLRMQGTTTRYKTCSLTLSFSKAKLKRPDRS